MVGVVTITGAPFAAMATSNLGFSGVIGSESGWTHGGTQLEFSLLMTQGSSTINVIEFGQVATASNQLAVAGLPASGNLGHFHLRYRIA